MHERTERLLCRLAFVLLCALPTLATAGLVTASRTAWYRARQLTALERSLSERFGVQIEIGTMTALAPGTTRLEQVVLRDPETEAEVGRVRQITWHRREGQAVLMLAQPELQSAQLPHAWRLVHDRFFCQPSLVDRPVRLVADDLTIHSRHGGLTLSKADAWIGRRPHGVEATLLFVPADRDESQPAQIRVVRDRSGTRPTTAWSLDTGGSPLPCSAVSEYLPVLARLGPRAQWNGTLRWRLDEEGWEVDLSGSNCAGIEMGELFAPLPHRLTGTARLRLDRCRVRAGKLVDVSGSLVVEGGYVGATLLRAAAEHLQMELVDPTRDLSSDPVYERLAVHFDLLGNQLRIGGTCHLQPDLLHLPPGVVAVAGGQPLVVTGRSRMLAAVQLNQMLAPDHGVPLIVSQQTGWLLGLLPLPQRPIPEETPPSIPRVSLRE